MGAEGNMKQMSLSPEVQAGFMDLVCRLSPENLACDGEIPQSQVRTRHAQIMREWVALERRAGRKITEDEVWKNNARGH